MTDVVIVRTTGPQTVQQSANNTLVSTTSKAQAIVTTAAPQPVKVTPTAPPAISVITSPVAAPMVITTPPPATVVTRLAGVGPQGIPGPQGPAGASGAGATNLFVQQTAPTGTPPTYMWVQTGLGASAKDLTFWIEDNLP